MTDEAPPRRTRLYGAIGIDPPVTELGAPTLPDTTRGSFSSPASSPRPPR